MSINKTLFSVLFSAALALSANVASAVLPTIQSTDSENTINDNTAVSAFLVQPNVDGTETLVPVGQGVQIKQNDILEYQGYFTNKTADRIHHMTIDMGIPAQVELLGNVSPTSNAFASADGHTFSRMPLKTHDASGQTINLPLSFYKTLRFNVENVGINGVAVVKYRARVK